MSDQAMEPNCEHFYATHVRGGEPVSVRACTLSGQPDWPDLKEQVDRLVEAALAAPRAPALFVQTAIAALDAMAEDEREPARYRRDFQAAAEAFRRMVDRDRQEATT